MEVVILPLAEPSSPNSNVTLVGGPQTQSVVLNQDANPVTFRLVPTDHPDLTERVLYRAAWREKYLGRQYVTDFVMPDFDCNFDDLTNLGNIIGGETYLQWADVGVPNGVARLDGAGRVVDAGGEPLTGADDAAAVQGRLNHEIVARQAGDTYTRNYVEATLNEGISQVLGVVADRVAQGKELTDNALVIERAGRQQADADLAAAIADQANYQESRLAAFTALTDDQYATLAVKADLVGGKVPVSQLPSQALSRAVTVVSEAAMLALTDADVQPGDICVNPQGTWFLNYSPPSILGNWTKLTSPADVVSVNNRRGVVVLNADDVGARSSSVAVPLGEVNGLTAALAAKADGTVVSGLTNRVSAIETDPTLVHTVNGSIPHSAQSTDLVFFNQDDLLVKKDGTRLSIPGGGGPIAVEDVVGLPVTLTSLGNRITAVEGGGGGGVSSAKAATFDAAAPTSDMSIPVLKSPFGIRSNGTPYYNPAGADEGEWAYPYITPNGHLKLVKRNESNPEDPEVALKSSLDALTSTVSGKASQANLDSLTSTVSGKASQASVDSLTSTVAAKASQASVDSLTSSLAAKADSSSLASATSRIGDLEGAVALKADLTAGRLSPSQIPINIPQGNVTNLTATLAAKADLVNGVLTSGQVPSGIAQSKIADLATTLAAKADLVNGKIPSSQYRQPVTSSVANRAAMLALSAVVGDMCVITTGADTGTYTLIGSPSTQFSSWLKHSVPAGTVSSVNGQSGEVALTAADVGARAAGSAVAMSDVTGLNSALSFKVDTSTYTSGLAGKTSSVDVDSQISRSSQIKGRADYVAVSAVPSRSGQQSVDGVLMPLGSVVLLTAQSSSSDNGLYVVSSGTWNRTTDMATGDFFVKGTLVLVASGTAQASTFWQQTSPSGAVGTNANNWVKVMTAGAPPVFTASRGVQRIGDDFRAAVVVGGGISAVAGGLQLDPNVGVRKWVGDVPAGSTTAILTHNLGTTDVFASFRDKGSGDQVLAGWRPTGLNTISVEFEYVPAFGQYRAFLIG